MNLRLLTCAAVLLPFGTHAASAQALPATAPTTLPAAATQNAPIVATPTTEPPHHAEVTYAAGLLNVRANNSSLNQILRQITQLTGMKVTGGVADERVFGNYGPADPPTILATLLNGTGSNMLLRQSETTGEPLELVLTPRNGGPTPPSPTSAEYSEPNQPAFTQHATTPPNHLPTASPASASNTVPGNGPVPPGSNGPASNGPQPIPQPLNNVLGSPSNTDPTASTLPTANSVPLDTVATPSTASEPTGIVDAPNPPPPGSTTNPNPNGVATPEQIYQQLKALQQKNTQPSSTPAPQ